MQPPSYSYLNMSNTVLLLMATALLRETAGRADRLSYLPVRYALWWENETGEGHEVNCALPDGSTAVFVVSRRTQISVAVGNNTAFQKVGKREDMVTGAMVSL
jgi:hypothetical protein